MPRIKTIPDTEILATVRQLLAAGGDKAVAFASVARATGLAAPTLVQRFGTRDAMVEAAVLEAWDMVHHDTAQAETTAPISPKGVQVFLKMLGEAGSLLADTALLAQSFRSPALRKQAEDWRARVGSRACPAP